MLLVVELPVLLLGFVEVSGLVVEVLLLVPLLSVALEDALA